MANRTTLPDLTGWDGTRETLKWACRAVGVVPRAHAEPQPNWWHISLRVRPDGLHSVPMDLPDGRSFHVWVDLQRHAVVMTVDGREASRISLTDGLTGTQIGDGLTTSVAELGLVADYAREKYHDDETHHYDREAAGRYLHALQFVDGVFKAHRATLRGETGPVQLWPHGFDLAFEVFGSLQVESEGAMSPAQINLGFSPGEPSHPEPYFYSNPWPFDRDALLGRPLPEGARWHTNVWEGTILPYSALVGDPQAGERLRRYARQVYDLAWPTINR